MPKLNTNTERGALGKRGEDIATKCLEDKGFMILERNFECKLGEIDIIAVDRDTNLLVFVEVKSRRSFSYGVPSLSVVNKKQAHIRNSAMAFLLRSEKYLRKNEIINTDTEYRFDVIAVVFCEGDKNIEHIEGAFQ